MLALKGIRNVVTNMVADKQKRKLEVPEPLGTRDYSGKMTVRIPPEIHRKLAMDAAEENVSINRLVSAKLSR